MGSKNLKNIGTPMVVDHLCHMGIFPTKNFLGTGAYDPIEQIGTAVQATRNTGKEHCYGCPVGCSQVKLAKTGEYAGIMTEGPEFETMYSFGGATGVENIDAIIAADRLADEMGFDTISSGVSIAFAMELYEKGILTKEDTGGLELTFGNDKAMMTILRQMSYSYTPDEILFVGERINNLARAFNVGEGFTRADDTLPERLMTEPIPGGVSKGHFISREELTLMLDEYYIARGWDVKTGSPTRATLKSLNLEYAADALNL